MDNHHSNHVEANRLLGNGLEEAIEVAEVRGNGHVKYEFDEFGNDPTSKITAPGKTTIDTNIPTRVGLDGTTTTLGGCFIVANAAIGCGTLAFPQAFNNAGGLYVGIAMVGICAVLCMISLLACGITAKMTESSEFYEIARVLMGKWAEVIAQVFVFATNLGTCILYLIIIGDQIEKINQRIFGLEFYCDNWFVQRKAMIIAASLIVVFPLCLIKKVDFLKYPSMLSVFSMIYVMFAVTIKYFQLHADDSYVPPPLKNGPTVWHDVFKAFPTILFGYQCMTNACPVQANLKNQSMRNWFLVSAGTVVICTVVYLPTAMFGYLTNGDNVAGNILQNYSPEDNMMFVAQCTVLLSVMMTYPVVYYIARNALDPMYTSARKKLSDGDYDPMASEALRRYVTATVWYICALLAALLIPNITVAIDFAGTVAVFFYLIFPGLYVAKVAARQRETLGETRSIVCIVIGVSMLILGLALFAQGWFISIQKFINPGKELPDTCETFFNGLKSVTSSNGTVTTTISAVLKEAAVAVDPNSIQ